MTAHLSDEQLAQLLDGNASPKARAHLKQCDACSGELSMLQAALAELPQQALRVAERDDMFWRTQRSVISERVARTPGPRAVLQWSLAFAALLLVAVLMNQPFSVQPVDTARATVTDPDHELLLQIEQTMNRHVPDALAPADLLVTELSSAVKEQSNP